MSGKKRVSAIIWSILLVPLSVLLAIIGALFLPADYIKYKRSRYYEDIHSRYRLFCGSSRSVELYGSIKEQGLPVEYYEDADMRCGDGYFIYKDILILCDASPCFDEDEGKWVMEADGDYADLEDAVKSALCECNGFMRREVCKRVAVFAEDILSDDEEDGAPDTAIVPENESFIVLHVENDDLAGALSRLIDG